MTAALVVLCPLLITALAAGMVVAYLRSSAAVLAARSLRRVIVTLKTDDAFAGLLFSTDREALVLREAEALAYGQKKGNVIVEGELVVLRTEVAYIQVLPSEVAR